MIVWVAERAAAAKTIARVIIATDDQRVANTVRAHGHEAVMTRADHATGTDRLAEVATNLADADIIVNVQGDEPLISPDTIDAAVNALETDATAGIATTWETIEAGEDVVNPNVVKIVLGEDRRALYFSRSPVPFPREAVSKYGSLSLALESEPKLLASFKKHTGLYVYRRDVLLKFPTFPQTELEKSEQLEQLRAIENGVKIIAVQAATSSIGVDTAADLQRVAALVANGSISKAYSRNE